MERRFTVKCNFGQTCLFSDLFPKCNQCDTTAPYSMTESLLCFSELFLNLYVCSLWSVRDSFPTSLFFYNYDSSFQGKKGSCVWLSMGQWHLTKKKIFISKMDPCFQLNRNNKELPVILIIPNVWNKQE